jgi:hypothetical protein
MSARRHTKLERVHLESLGAPPDAACLTPVLLEMPSIRFAHVVPCDGIMVDAVGWTDDDGFVAVDRKVAGSNSHAIVLRGPAAELPGIALEVLTRCQRFIDRRNAASSSVLWDTVYLVHASLHDCSKPLVAADLDHAVDTWQWMLRLSPNASLAAQLGALFHDIERLESEADRRVEHHAPDYAAFKNRHAGRGADRTYEVLRSVSVDEVTALRVREIVATHECRGHDAEVDLLNDADALSFFSLNSPGYASYFGHEQTRKKVAYTLARLSPEARGRLAGVRLREEIRAHLIALGAPSPSGRRRRRA